MNGLPGDEGLEDSGIIKLVNSIINDAVKVNASDIHIVPALENFQVDYRIEGLLENQGTHDKSLLPGLIARVKHMSCLDIAEKRLPQDGRIKIRVNNETLDIRISLVPGVLGEKITMRIIKAGTAVVDLEDMRFDKDILNSIYSMLQKPWGLIFVTGTTGSGKTTTCYGLLNYYLQKNLSVITVEDPVEYVLPGATHIQIRNDIGLNFPSALKSAMRTDPDVVFVGEIRDTETLKIAVQAAQCGHIVICQMFSEDIQNLIDLLSSFEGLDKAVMANALIGVISQKLLRSLCSECKVKAGLDSNEKQSYNKEQSYTAKGCSACLESGYRGRIPCNNVLIADHQFKTAFAQGSSGAARALIKTGLIDNARKLQKKGLTSNDEIYRVFGIENNQG
jgi:type II secretory ATPase GspE/PulE/Tfp pilus assembly ATPase PilB-like protein